MPIFEGYGAFKYFFLELINYDWTEQSFLLILKVNPLNLKTIFITFCGIIEKIVVWHL